MVYYPVLEGILRDNDESNIKKALADNISDLIPKHITKDDILLQLTIICTLNMA